MDKDFYQNLTEQSIADKSIPYQTARDILRSGEIALLPLLNSAFEVRKKYKGKQVTIHIINNAQNGFCPEDCHYCAQAKSSNANIEEYPLKPDHEILAEAQNAYEKGAYRYCMVFAGRGPSQKRIEHLARLIREIKARYPIQVCVSPGLLDKAKAQILKEAGLDRLNHNLNTSQRNYPKICTTHSYQDRINTLSAAQQAGLQICSGIILGMQETAEDIIELAMTLKEMKVESIPVNFLIPIEGNVLDQYPKLSPEFCLRVLCLLRFFNPKAEIRIAAGREIHLRQMQVMALYPANSLFLDGYLNARGDERRQTLQMIKDAGFSIESHYSIDELLQTERLNSHKDQSDLIAAVTIKELHELRPAFQQHRED